MLTHIFPFQMPRGEVEKVINKPKNAFSKEIKEFTEKTSCHGIKRVLDRTSKNNWLHWKNIIWFLLTLICFGMACQSLIKIIADYNSHPVSTLLKKQFSPGEEFPTVSFCNLNLLVPPRLGIYPLLQAYWKNAADSTKLDQLKRVFADLKEDEQKSVGHVLKEMLIECTIFGKRCTIDDFHWFCTYTYGNCFSFNHILGPRGTRQKLRKLQNVGKRSGLTLTLDIQSDMYLPMTNEVGVNVVIHQTGLYPYMGTQGLFVAPGFHTDIGLTMEETIDSEPPYGTCLRRDGKGNKELNMFAFRGYHYGRRVCLKSCQQVRTIVSCGCCDRTIPCNPDGLMEMFGFAIPEQQYLPTCNVTELCIKDIREIAYKKKICEDFCPPECRVVSYQKDYSVALWPNKFKSQGLFKRISGDSRLNNASDDDKFTFVRGNVMTMDIYFKSQNKNVVVVQPTYSWDLLLCNIGGQLGLWLGFSLLTAFEFVELLLDAVLFGMKTTWRCIRVHLPTTTPKS